MYVRVIDANDVYSANEMRPTLSKAVCLFMYVCLCMYVCVYVCRSIESIASVVHII